MFGIIGAMKEEVNYFISNWQVVQTVNKAGMKFYYCKVGKKLVIVVQSGIGKVNAAAATQALIDCFSVNKVIFSGFAGSVKEKINIEDFVVANKLCQHDFDLVPFGREKGFVPGFGKYIQADKVISDRIVKVFKELKKTNKNFPKIHKGIIASGDQFVASKEQIEKITSEFNASAVEMEGAAVAQVCKINEVPFAVMRVISDKADEEAMTDFKDILKRSTEIEFKVITEVIKSFQLEEKEKK